MVGWLMRGLTVDANNLAKLVGRPSPPPWQRFIVAGMHIGPV
jgi:hypothetical protein